MYSGISVMQHERLHSRGSAEISRDTTISQLWLPVKKRARFASIPEPTKMLRPVILPGQHCTRTASMAAANSWQRATVLHSP